MIKMLQYKMYPAGELAVLRQLLFAEWSSAIWAELSSEIGTTFLWAELSWADLSLGRVVLNPHRGMGTSISVSV